MDRSIIRRCLTFLLALTFLLPLVPAQVMAEESESTAPTIAETTETSEASIETTPHSETDVDNNRVIMQYQQRIDSILITYLESTEFSFAEMKTIVDTMDWDTYQTARMEIHQLGTEIFNEKKEGIITEAEIRALLDENLLFLEFANALEEKNSADNSVSMFSAETKTGSISGLNYSITYEYTTIWLPFVGNQTTYYGGCTVANNSIEAWAEKQVFSNTTTTIVLSVADNSDKYLTFDYSISGGTCTFTVGSTSATITNSGKYTVRIKPGTSETLTLVCSDRKSTVTLSNFVLEAPATTFDVTFQHEDLGTVKTGSETIASGTTKTVNLDEGINLTATVNSGAKFLGWIDMSDYHIVSTEASFNYTNKGNATLQAVFASSTTKAWFNVNGTHLFDNLTTAAQAGTKVTLAHDGVLSGSHTIPAGVTLLIPYDAAGTLCTTRPSYHENAYTAPTVFRTLTMANGANITVNGAISVASAVSSKQDCAGSPSGPYGHIKMESGSKITVASNATLYAWGYITGSGSVEVKSSGKVYECVQVTSFRGGDVTSQMTSEADTYGVFPFNQYYVQNVEVPMTLHCGATETGLAYIYVTLAGVQTMELPFIGNVDGSSMFVINSGYVVKDYLEGTGRTKIQVYGDLSVTEISVSMKISTLGRVTIDTSKYALPIPHHFTISLESGNITMNQSMAFLPGSELYIGEGTTCTLGSKKKIYVYDLDQWLYNDGANGYSGIRNLPYMQLKYVPGGDSTASRLKDALIQIDGTVDATAGSVYVTAGGANIYSTGTGVAKVTPGTDKKTYQIIQNNTDISSWPEIPIVPAILQNAAGKDPASTNTAETTGAYVYRNGIWCPHTDTVYRDSNKDHKCDTCGTVMSACSDVTGDGNHSCDICGTENVSSHTGGAAATCTTAQICTECGATVTPAMGHKWSGTKCSACGIIKLYATNIRAGDFLNMFFYVRAADLDLSEGKNYYAHIEKTYADKRPNVTKDIYYRNADGSQNWETYETDYLRFRFDDISAKEMTDEIHVTIFDSDGKQISTVTTETLRDYAMRLLKTLTSDDLSAKNKKLRTTLIDMLNYGAAAQDFFGDYGINDLANAGCEAYQGWVTGDDVSCEKGTTDKTQGLDSAIVVADNGLTLRLYFNNLSDTTGLTATISYQNHHGNKVERTTTEFDTTTASPLVGVGITGLAIADGRQLVTCTITNGEDTTVASGTYSVERYLAMHKADDAVYLKLMKFIDSAYNYFHS